MTAFVIAPARGAAARLSTLLALSVLLSSASSGRLLAQEEGSFVEEVVVQEIAVVVDPARVLSPRALRQLAADDLLVFEDGKPRIVTRLEPIVSEPAATDVPVFEEVEVCPWTIVVYVDAVLADSQTIYESAVMLGQRADVLTGMGCVDVVMADPVPRIVVARSRSTEYVTKILVDLATAARQGTGRDPVLADWPPGDRDRDIPGVEVQWDRLLSFAAGRRAAAPKALFLITDGFTLPPADMDVLSGRRAVREDRSGERTPANLVIDAAQTLSSYGWLTVAMPGVHLTSESQPSPVDEFDDWREVAEGRTRAGERRTAVNFFGTTRAGRPGGDFEDRLYEAYVLPSLAPLRALVEATSGELAWNERQLDDALRDLRQRRLLWFRAAEPHDGRIRRLLVSMRDSGAHLAAPWWKRSSTPHLVAESRLRRLAGGECLDRALDVSASFVEAASAGEQAAGSSLLRVRVAPVDLGRRESIGHVRVTVGFLATSGALSFDHRVDYDAPRLGDAWEYTLAIQIPAGTERLVVGVEDLSLEEWGATTVERPKEGGA